MADGEDLSWAVEKTETVYLVEAEDVVDEGDILYQPPSNSKSSQELVSEDIATLSFVMEPGQSSGRGKRNSMPTKKAAALAALATKQQDTYKGSDESNSPKKIIRFRHDSDDDYPAPKKSMPKIVLKNTSHTLSKRECDLIKDCVDALADQDSLATFNLRTRTDNLCKADWWMLSDIMVKLMRQYLPEKGIDVIDHKHIEQARYQMKQTYKWGGHVVGKDFHYCQTIRSIKQDSCYNAMRNRNNFSRPKAKSLLTRRTVVRKTHSSSKKMRTADSYGVLVYENLDVEEMSDEKREAYEAFCQEISKVPVGRQLTQQQIETANSYWDCLMESLVNVRPDEYLKFVVSDKLVLLRHLRLYSNFVQKITQREDTVIVKFQENCDMFLACLQDLLKHFPPTDVNKIKSLDIHNHPYISMIKIIASQIGRTDAFILDHEVMTQETMHKTGPICLVRSGNLYHLCINGVTVVPNLQEIQGVFCLATSEDVFRLSQVKVSDSTEVIDFMRKFLLDIPDFHIKRPKIALLGQAFRYFSDFERARNGRCPRPNKLLCYEKANEAIQCY